VTKSVPAPLRTHFDQETTALTTCIYFRRQDGVEFRFTELDQNLPVPGPKLDARGRDVSGTFLSAGGQTPSSISSASTLSVDNLEIVTVLSNAGITEVDMYVGRWDYADYDIFQVPHEDPSIGIMWLMSGKLGEVSMSRGSDTGTVELRSKSVQLQEPFGRLVSHECPTDLGALDCAVIGLIYPWVTLTAYALGDRIRSSVWERRHYVCTTAGTSGVNEPVWNLALDATTTDATVVWTTYSPLRGAQWLATTVYALNTVVTATAFDKRQYRCTTAGTSSGSEPTWNTTLAATTADGSVVWTTELGISWDGSATSVTDQTTFEDTALTDATLVDDWFKYGMLTWLTGDNAGLESEVKTYTKATGTVVFWSPVPFAIQIGDTYVIETGCDKSPITCKDKFNNKLNFQGFEHVPGRDVMIQTPGSKAS